MASYGRAECAKCHVRMDKPSMVRKRFWSVTRPAQRNYFNARGRSRGYSRTQGKLKTREVWLCRRCANGSLTLKLIVIGALGLFLLSAALPH